MGQKLAIAIYSAAAVWSGMLVWAVDIGRCSPNADKPFIYVLAGAAWPAAFVTTSALMMFGEDLPLSCATLSSASKPGER